MVRFLLIGGGAGGRAGSTSAGGAGGGSGGVTSWIGPAMFVPDVLRVFVGVGGASAAGGSSSNIIYQAKDGTGYTLLNANAASGQSGASVETNNYFGAAGIFTSVGGQSGANTSGNITASTTTFLSGGGGGGTNVTSGGGNVGTKYGYPALSGGTAGTGANGADGYFLFQPILISQGGSGGAGSSTAAGGNGGNGGIGCGGGGAGRCTSGTASGGRGGDGAVFIWSW